MKQYSVRFVVSIHDKSTTYPEVKPIDIEVKENLPADVDPQRYVRGRIAEELSRHFAAKNLPIENRTEGEPADDPLAVF